MKVIAAREMSRIEEEAFREGCSESEFMENAGRGIADVIEQETEVKGYEKKIALLCGKGNNAGDAYVAGVFLMERGFEAKALQLSSFDACSPLCQENASRFIERGGEVVFIEKEDDIRFFRSGWLLDGILGTGFKGTVQGIYARLIEAANRSALPIASIDIPSGLNGNNGSIGGTAIKASHTIFLGLPKTGFFLLEGWNCVGRLHHVDFGLASAYVDLAKEDFIYLSRSVFPPLLPRLLRNRHKYQSGYVVGLAGSPGMSGAAILASYSAMRAGAGIVRLLHPEGMQAELLSSPYELIKQAYRAGEEDRVIEELNRAGAIFLGPGIGTSDERKETFRRVLPKIHRPCVLDADALNIFSLEETSLPKDTILTPHLGEMHRLLSLKERHPLDLRFLRLCASYSKEKNASVILKGAPTFLFFPGETPFLSPYGDPGMATAGSGDVLTGILAALLAQRLSVKDAVLLGVYIHSLAGECAADQLGSYSLMATDIIDSIPLAYEHLQ